MCTKAPPCITNRQPLKPRVNAVFLDPFAPHTHKDLFCTYNITENRTNKNNTLLSVCTEVVLLTSCDKTVIQTPLCIYRAML